MYIYIYIYICVCVCVFIVYTYAKCAVIEALKQNTSASLPAVTGTSSGARTEAVPSSTSHV